MLYEVLKARSGMPSDLFTMLWAKKMKAIPEQEITDTLPLSFIGRVQKALTDYRLYGTSEGAGVETENYFSLYTPTTGSRKLNADGSTTSASFWLTTDYFPVNGRTFTLSPVASNVISASICAYDSDKNLIKGQAYGTISDTPYDVTISCDSDVSFIRFCYYAKVVAKPTIMLVPGSTAPASFIPYGYQILLTDTSGQNTDTYPLYIGSTQLGAEEYVDYQEQKIYKTKITWVCTVTTGTNNRVRYQFKPTIDDAYFASGVTTAGIIRIENTVSYLRPETEGSTVVEVPTDYASITTLGGYSTDAGNGTSACAFLVINEVYYYSDTLSYTYDYAHTNQPISVTNMNGNVVPTDPPSPLPPITAYEGENTLSSTETVGSVTVKGYITSAT